MYKSLKNYQKLSKNRKSGAKIIEKYGKIAWLGSVAVHQL